MGLVALGLTAAMAASSDGAIVINDHQCFDASGGYTICYDLHVEGNQTTAASGNVSLEQNGFVNQSLIDPSGNTVASATQDVHYHTLWMAKTATLQEGGAHYSFSSTSGGTTCTSSFDIHIANGSVQYDNFSSACS